MADRKAPYAVCATDEFNYYVHYQVQSEHNDNWKIRLNTQEKHTEGEIALYSLRVSNIPRLSQAACFQI